MFIIRFWFIFVCLCFLLFVLRVLDVYHPGVDDRFDHHLLHQARAHGAILCELSARVAEVDRRRQRKGLQPFILEHVVLVAAPNHQGAGLVVQLTQVVEELHHVVHKDGVHRFGQRDDLFNR